MKRKEKKGGGEGKIMETKMNSRQQEETTRNSIAERRAAQWKPTPSPAETVKKASSRLGVLGKGLK